MKIYVSNFCYNYSWNPPQLYNVQIEFKNDNYVFILLNNENT